MKCLKNMIFKFSFSVKNLPKQRSWWKFFFKNWSQMTKNGLKCLKKHVVIVKYKFCTQLQTHLQIYLCTHLRTHLRIHLRIHLRMHLRTHQKSKFKNHVFKAFHTILSRLRPTLKKKMVWNALKTWFLNFDFWWKIY